MLTNANLKHITTLNINKTLICCCQEKKINISDVIRNTLHFLLAMDNFINRDINELLEEIIKEYESSESIPLSNEKVLVKVHFTKKQYTAYEKLPKNTRTTILNKILSIAINNYGYTNITIYNNCNTITKDPIINDFTIYFFINKDINPGLITICMENLLAKLGSIINQNKIVESFYKNLYCQFFNKKDSQDFYNQHNLVSFLYEEFKKIYFCMLITYNIKISEKSNTSSSRKIKKKYKNIFEIKHRKNLEEFIENEINIDKSLNDLDQLYEFQNFIVSLFPSRNEQEIVTKCFLPHFIFQIGADDYRIEFS